MKRARSFSEIQAREKALRVPAPLRSRSHPAKGHIGVVVTHGWTASPPAIDSIAGIFNRLGWNTLTPRLARHATTCADFERSRWEEWAESVEEAWRLLEPQCDRIFFAGESLGGLLSLYQGSRLPCAGIISLAAPFRFADRRIHLLPFLKRFVKRLPQVIPEMPDGYYYHWKGVGSAAALLNMQRQVTRRLNQVEAPVLLIQGRHDSSAAGASIPLLYRGVSSRHKSVLWLNATGHEVPYAPPADFAIMEKAIVRFCRECLE